MQRTYNITSIVIVLLLCFIIFRTCEGKKNLENIIEESKDSLTTWRDKHGVEHAKVSVLEGSLADLKKLNSTKDSTLKKLQALVDKNTQTAIVLSNTTINKGKGKTKVTFPGNNPGYHHITFNSHNEVIDSLDLPKDSFNIYECPPCPLPTYSDSINDKWFKGMIVANADSTTWNLKTFNEYKITEEYERDRFWKEKKLKLNIVNLNPNTTTTEALSWMEKKPKVKRGIIFGLGILAGSIGTFIGIKEINTLSK